VAQGYPPRRSERPPARRRRGYSDQPGRPRRSDRPVQPRLDAFDDDPDEDLPPWAGASIYPTGPGRRELRPPTGRADVRETAGRVAGPDQGWAGPPDTDQERPQEGPGRSPGRPRAAAARARRSRRRLLAGGGLVVVVAVVVLWLTGNLPWQGHPAPSSSDGLVTTFLPGEFRTVPDACHAIGAATLAQYMPGRVTRVAQSLGGAAQSQCTWTLDIKPDFRVLTVNSQAFAPSLLSSGNGSATFGAIDAYQQQLQQLQHPPKSSGAPKAQLGTAVGLGRDAFTALKVFRVGGVVTDEVTVVVRDRNVLIVVTMQGQQRGGGFGPVPLPTLRAGALAAAHEVLAGIR
jgi:hypothetical protein